MKILLDTHAVLWALSDDRRLSRKAKRAYEEASELLFSVVSLWEIGIKVGLQRDDFQMAETWWRDIPQALVGQGGQRLEVTAEHCRRVAGLPLYHRDPFDRMLIAQALEEGCALVSIDESFDPYGVERIW